MRVTQNTLFRNLINDLNRNREDIARQQNDISSGKSVNKASDNSRAFTEGQMIQNSLDRISQYQKNIQSGLQQANTAENALNGIVDQLTQLKSVVVRGATDSIDASGRKNLAAQVESIKKIIIDQANTKSNDKYLFGGTNILQTPFSQNAGSTGGVGDNSNNKELTTQISDTGFVNYSVTGKELRNTSAGDLFGIINNVENALNSNNIQAVNSSIKDIDTALNHVTTLTSRVGDVINRMNFTSNQFEQSTINQKGDLSQLVDTDLAKAMSKIQQYQTSYQAALLAHSKITQATLANYL